MSDTPPAHSQDGPERRKPRRRVLLTAVLAHLDLSVSFRCAIRDRSESGARLKLPEGITIPAEFWMIDVAEGLAFPAKTVWRNYPEIGVALDRAIDLKPRTLEGPPLRLRALWIEAAPRR
jgi:hypothetical protein